MAVRPDEYSITHRRQHREEQMVQSRPERYAQRLGTYKPHGVWRERHYARDPQVDNEVPTNILEHATLSWEIVIRKIVNGQDAGFMGSGIE